MSLTLAFALTLTPSAVAVTHCALPEPEGWLAERIAPPDDTPPPGVSGIDVRLPAGFFREEGPLTWSYIMRWELNAAPNAAFAALLEIYYDNLMQNVAQVTGRFDGSTFPGTVARSTTDNGADHASVHATATVFDGFTTLRPIDIVFDGLAQRDPDGEGWTLIAQVGSSRDRQSAVAEAFGLDALMSQCEFR